MSTDFLRLPLRDCAYLLGFKDVRSARRWCKNHGVAILCDVGTKTPYVLKTEYEAARLNSLVTYLKGRYGADWKQALTAYQLGDIDGILTMNKATKRIEDSKSKPGISGKNSSRFYTDLMHAISEART